MRVNVKPRLRAPTTTRIPRIHVTASIVMRRWVQAYPANGIRGRFGFVVYFALDGG